MINRKKYKEFDKYEKFKRFELTAFFLLCLLMPLHEVAAAKGSSTSGLVAEVQRLNDIGDFEAVINSLFAGKTVDGHRGRVERLPVERILPWLNAGDQGAAQLAR